MGVLMVLLRYSCFWFATTEGEMGMAQFFLRPAWPGEDCSLGQPGLPRMNARDPSSA